MTKKITQLVNILEALSVHILLRDLVFSSELIPYADLLLNWKSKFYRLDNCYQCLMSVWGYLNLNGKVLGYWFISHRHWPEHILLGDICQDSIVPVNGFSPRNLRIIYFVLYTAISLLLDLSGLDMSVYFLFWHVCETEKYSLLHFRDGKVETQACKLAYQRSGKGTWESRVLNLKIPTLRQGSSLHRPGLSWEFGLSSLEAT